MDRRHDRLLMFLAAMLTVSVLSHGAQADGLADDAPSIQSAIALVHAAGGGVVELPPGIYRLGGPLVISSGQITIAGSGPGTILRADYSAGDVIAVAGTATARINHITIRDLHIEAAMPHASGSVFRVESARYFSILDVTASWFHRLAILGHPERTDDVLNINLARLRFKSAGATTPPGHCIELVSGGIGQITDCFFNGTPGSEPRALIAQVNPLKNWDGLALSGIVAEQWPYHIMAIGAGIANLQASNFLFDRAIYSSILARPSGGGTCHEWNIANGYLAGDAANAMGAPEHIGIRLSETSGGHVAGLTFSNLRLRYFQNRALQVGTGVERIRADLQILDCAELGAPAITVETDTRNIHLSGQIDSASGLMGYGIEWQGSGLARAATLTISGAAQADSIGTP